MARITLTDLALRNLKPSPTQTQYWDASLPSFGCRVSPRGTKTFNVMTGTDRRLIKLGNYPKMTLSEARRAAHDILDGPTKERIQYQVARQLFIEKHLKTLKPTTCHEQTNLMKRFPFSKSLAAITLDDINRVLADMPRGSARSCYNVFRTFLNWCVANDYLDHTPLKTKSPYKPRTRDRLLSDAEVRLIWHESYNHNSFGSIARVLLLTGQRLSQITNLDARWLRHDAIAFPANIMKSNQEHTIPLTTNVLKELVNTVEGTSLFFPAPCGTRPFSSHSTAMAKFRRALPGIPHFTLHDFRRYFSSTHAKLRTPIDVTEALLNHIGASESRSQVQRIYDHCDRMPEMRRALLAYEHHLEKAVITP